MTAVSHEAAGELAVLLADLQWSWHIDELPAVLGPLGLRMSEEDAGYGQLALEDGDGDDPTGHVLLTGESGDVVGLTLRVTPLADPDDDEERAAVLAEAGPLAHAIDARLGPGRPSGSDVVWELEGRRLELQPLYISVNLALLRGEAQ